MKLTGGAIVVRALEDEGIAYTFGIPGTHNIELYDALAESDACARSWSPTSRARRSWPTARGALRGAWPASTWCRGRG